MRVAVPGVVGALIGVGGDERVIGRGEPQVIIARIHVGEVVRAVRAGGRGAEELVVTVADGRVGGSEKLNAHARDCRLAVSSLFH